MQVFMQQLNMDIQSLFTMSLLFFIFILILYYYSTHYSKLGKNINKIPGPKWYPFIGNTMDLLVPLEDLWNFLRRCGTEFYPVYKLWLLNCPVVLIRHPDDVEIMLTSNKNISKSKFYNYLHPWLKEGLLTSTGDKWRTRRKIITPAFHLGNLQQYSDNIVEQTERLIANLKNEAKSGEIEKELLPMISQLTLHTICETAMGTKLNENDPVQNNYKNSVYAMGNILYYRLVRPWLHNHWIFALTSKGRSQTKVLKTLHGFTTKIIEERQKYHDEMNEIKLEDYSASRVNSSNTELDTKTKKKRLAFLDLLIDASKRIQGLDNQGISEEVDTFVFEGHDTTAVSLFFTLLLLAEHKDIQTNARNEINTILKETDGRMTINEVRRFDYLDRCIKESLRLYPSVPLISREVTEDMQLKHCFLPTGTILNLQIVDVHRDPNFWPQPDIYDPDRFLPERIDKRHPFSYVPFSAGPRNCIGQKFAMLELKIMIAGLLQNFYLEPLDIAANIRIMPDLVLRAAHPVYMKFVPIVKTM